MARIKRFLIPIKREGGFSLAEVMVAFVLLAFCVLPMVSLFDGARLVSMTAHNINIASECLQLYTELARSLPFYEAHSESDLTTKLDLDDFYWGSRNPINDNDWTDAPREIMKSFDADPYPDVQVTLKMSYIDDELVTGVTLEEAANATNLDPNWQPMALYGYDRPKTDTGKILTLILFEVMVTTREGQTFSDTELYASPTDVVANVYIDRVVNVSADSTKKGTRDNAYGECISAPHTRNSITIRAYGEGFTQADLDAGLVDVKLVRVEDTDIQLEGMTLGTDGTETYIEGTIDLNDYSGSKEPWGPDYRMPGYWHAWLVVNHIISVRNNAFVVEYPEPVYDDATSGFSDSDGDKTGTESTTDETITFTDLDYIMNFVTGSYPNPGVGAVVQLVHTIEDNGNPIDVITGTNIDINPSALDGYQGGLTVTADFDFRGHVGGDYMVRVTNCIDRATPDKDVMGNTYFELDNGPFYYLEGPPALTDVYVYEATPLTSELRHFGYDDRSYSYTLEIKGYNFDNLINVNDVKLGLDGNTSDDPPSGATNEFNPIAVTVVDSETLQATFDFAPEVEETERGMYWLWVRNSNGFGTALDNAFDVRQPAPIIYSYSVTSKGIWQNYHHVGLEIVGECFDEDALSGDYYDIMIKEDAVPANDWLATEAMDAPVASDFGRNVQCEINLVECNTGDWELYGLAQPAGLTDSGYTDPKNGHEYTSMIDVTLGKAMLLTADVPVAGEDWSISVCSRYRNYDPSASDWKAWQPWVTSTEGDGSRAWVYENDEGQTTEANKTQGEMYFVKLYGMGFDPTAININCVNEHGEDTDPMDATWGDVPVLLDRATASVWIEMTDPATDARKTGPHKKDDGSLDYISLRIQNTTNSVWSDWYVDRIEVKYGPSY